MVPWVPITCLSRFCFASLVLTLLLRTAAGQTEQPPVDFQRDILPILSDRCFQCHGPDEAARQAEFRLDQRASATGEAESGERPIVPGDSASSELLRRLTTDDEYERMPPPESKKKPITAGQIELLRQWIDQGAAWQQHWAFAPPRRPALPDVQQPDVQQDDWPGNEIDRFVHKRLEGLGLSPAAEAGKTELIRRVTLSLTGLPPTLEEIDAYLADESPDAYEAVVDRLLASEHYGERMAWPWLEAVRYADTSGYQGDPERTMWPWRDLVVAALNDNVPFDQFTIEQLAGDLLPNATLEQRIASGFHRNHMHNGEGGRIAEETRVENVFDRTETTATVWMGLTFTCARCHSHKFDPITQRDYYALFDFFNQTSETGTTAQHGRIPPVLEYLPQEVRKDLQELDRQIAQIQQQLDAPDPSADATQVQWEGRQTADLANDYEVLEPVEYSTQSDARLELLDDRSLRAVGAVPQKDVYRIVCRTDRGRLRAVRLEALPDDVASPAGSTGRAGNGNAVLSELEIAVRPAKHPAAAWQPVKFVSAQADHAQPGYPAEQAIDGNNAGGAGWATEGFKRKKQCTAEFVADQPFGFEDGTELQILLRCESHHAAHVLARVRLAVASRLGLNDPHPEVAAILATAADQRTEPQRAALRRFYRTQLVDRYRQLERQLAELHNRQANLRKSYQNVQVMVMDTGSKRRETRMLEKGIYNSPFGEPVAADVPSALPPLPESTQRDRMALARWLVSPEHPLTAQVTANRYWQTFFGRGIVATPGDFGTQGERPTHPDLLAWLAREFVDSGWDVKRIHRLIVTSATFRQSSQVTRELRERDPDNRFLARGPRFRLPAWMLRDQALAVSGLLVPKLGGPPVKPYQPPGIWAEATFGKKRYKQDHGENLYRRSLYIYWRRIVGPTMLFDVANRQTCTVKASRTNTPLHALATLNDVTYVEAARALAELAMKTHRDDQQRLSLLFRRLTARRPEPAELEILRARLNRLKEHFQQDSRAAAELLSVGERTRDESLDAAEHAAYAAICNMLMNLDEVLSLP